MKTTIRFIGLVGSLVCFGSGAAYAEGKSTPDDLLKNPPSATIPAPSIRSQGFRSQFAMRFVPPSPDIDFKIGKIAPDPGIDYKIKITGQVPQLFPVDIDTPEEELPMESE